MMSVAVQSMEKERLGQAFADPAEEDDVVVDDEEVDKVVEIKRPGPHDVLLGRGGGTNNHTGNVKFRQLVNKHKMRYLSCSKVDKPLMRDKPTSK